MKTIGLIIEKGSLPDKVPEKENKLPEAQTKDKPKKPSKPKKTPRKRAARNKDRGTAFGNRRRNECSRRKGTRKWN